MRKPKGIKRFTVRYRDRPNQGRPALRGQFFMLTVFGAGEIAISVPFSDRVKDAFTFYVKKVGKVTTAMHNLKVGDMMGLRGPFGVPLPYETLKGRDLLVVGSGVGHAPVRATLVRAIENKPDFGRIAIMASASTYDGLLLKDDLREWAKVPGVEVHYSLSKPTDQVDAHIGYINDLLPGLGLDWKNTSAIICASARRIKAVARDLMQLGMKPSDIYTALENQHALRHRQVRALQGREPLHVRGRPPCSRTRKCSSFRRSFRHIEEGRGTLSKGVRPSPFPLQPPAVIESLGPIPGSLIRKLCFLSFSKKIKTDNIMIL